MPDKIVNLYNKPFYAGLLLSAVDLILMVTTLLYYVIDPFELAMNSLFQGIAFMIDMTNIFWGYVIMAVIFILGLVIYNLGYGAKRSDHPRPAKWMRILALVSVSFATVLGVWFTLQVILAYRSAN